MQLSHFLRTPRRGFTLAEMTVALLLFSLVGGAILSLVMRQQRFYRSTAELIKQQGQLRQGGSVLPLDLRGISTADTSSNGIGADGKALNYNTDIYSRNDWSIEFRRIFGSSLVCARRTVAPLDTITIFPTKLTDVPTLTTWTTIPELGDSLLVLDEGRSLSVVDDDTWQVYEVRRVEAVTGADGCPWKVPADSSPLLREADNVRNSFKVALDRPLSNWVRVGSVVRFFRRARYEIYQAPDSRWYLGYSDCLRTYGTDSGCSDVSPVSGPFQAYSGFSTENGIVMTYYDTSGNELAYGAPTRLLARVDIKLRSVSDQAITRTGAGAGEMHRDSLLLSIGIRNRR
jgi:prepilin-type N-terminal cleavage/methylation domain-containing protein